MKKRFKILLCTVCVLVLYVSLLGAGKTKPITDKTNMKNNNLLAGTTKDYSGNLIAQYKLDETSGATCIDSKGANNGTYYGSTSITESGLTFRRFNGTSDYIEFSNPIIPIGKKSIEFKFRKNGAPSSREIIMENDYNNAEKGSQIRVETSGQITWLISQGNYSISLGIASVINVCDNQWHDILFTWDGATNANSVKAYVDNKNITSKTSTATSVESANNARPLLIGKGSIEKGFSGDISNIEMYNEVLDYTVKSKSITLNKATDTVEVDGTISDLVATVLPEDTTNKTVKWTSSNSDIAVVDEITGKVTAKSAGTVKITATTQDGTNLSASCDVTVKNPKTDRAVLMITMINNERKEYDLSADEIKKFIDWYNGNSSPSYAINKCNNVQPFNSRTEYIAHDKVSSFEVNQYTSTTK